MFCYQCDLLIFLPRNFHRGQHKRLRTYLFLGKDPFLDWDIYPGLSWTYIVCASSLKTFCVLGLPGDSPLCRSFCLAVPILWPLVPVGSFQVVDPGPLPGSTTFSNFYRSGIPLLFFTYKGHKKIPLPNKTPEQRVKGGYQKISLHQTYLQLCNNLGYVLYMLQSRVLTW